MIDKFFDFLIFGCIFFISFSLGMLFMQNKRNEVVKAYEYEYDAGYNSCLEQFSFCNEVDTIYVTSCPY